MLVKPDITSRNDIEKIVTSFYDAVRSNPDIAFFFSTVVPVNWDEHIQKMCSFWENVLFYTGDYEGNPLITHKNLSAKHEIKNEHFEIWLKLFLTAVNSLFEGDNAEKMKTRAIGIAAVMQERMKFNAPDMHK